MAFDARKERDCGSTRMGISFLLEIGFIRLVLVRCRQPGLFSRALQLDLLAPKAVRRFISSSFVSPVPSVPDSYSLSLVMYRWLGKRRRRRRRIRVSVENLQRENSTLSSSLPWSLLLDNSELPPIIKFDLHILMVLDDTSNAVHGSNIQWRGRSFAASVPSDSSKFQRVKKRLSKHERYSLVKSVVDRYRDKNAGKFPSITIIKKQTGGSHYTIREIIQRIEHDYCKQSVDKKFEAPADKPEKKILSQIHVEKESLVSTKFKVNSGSLEKAKNSDSILETGTTGKVHDHKILDETSQPIIVNYTGASAFGQIEGTEKLAATNSKASSKQDPAVHHAAGSIGMEVAQPLDVTENCKRDETTSNGPDYSSVSQSFAKADTLRQLSAAGILSNTNVSLIFIANFRCFLKLFFPL
ncbi:hypothetical protein ACLOJK_014285 [Asimina triloba]